MAGLSTCTFAKGLATIWSVGHGKMGKLQVMHDQFNLEPELRDATATCLTLTTAPATWTGP